VAAVDPGVEVLLRCPVFIPYVVVVMVQSLCRFVNMPGPFVILGIGH